MKLNVDPGFDADLELAHSALERGWLTREAIESAILAHEQTPGSRLLTLLPLTPDQLQKLQTPSPAAVPPEIAQVSGDPARQFDHYILGDFLHSGGMGRVYKAWDLKLSRWVALKCLKAVGDERSQAYFEREARLAAGLSHPNIAAIYESGRFGGERYIAMQYIPGTTLETHRKGDVKRLVTLVRDAARAVAHANARGVIHRDLKPSNLMVTPDGRVYVLDFGLARPADPDAAHTATGKAMGTPSYMSPEQARGGAVDARTDVYGLGATLYELLTGRPPFLGPTVYDVLRRVEEAAPARPRRLNPRVPADLETIVGACLEKDPARRYATADDLADDLDRFLNHDPIRARPAGAIYRTSRALAKRKAVAIACAASLLLAAVLGWWLLVGNPRAEQLRVEGEHLRLREEAMKLWAEARGLEMSGADSRSVPLKARAARKVFEEALAVREEPQAHLMKGRCLWLEGKHDEAMRAFERAASLDPNDAVARIELAKALLTKYRLSRGLAWNRIISHEKGGMDIQVEAKILQPESAELQRLRERADQLLAVREVLPTLAGLLNGLRFMGTGDYGPAAEELARYTRNEPWDRNALTLEGICRFHANKISESIQIFDRMLERAPNALIYWWRGTAKTYAGLYDSAIEDFARTLELEPTHKNAFNSRGLARALKKSHEEAISDFTRAIELDPGFAYAYNCRGMSRLTQRRIDEAVLDFVKVLELNPKDAGALANLGSAKGLQGKLDEAILWLTKSIELDPGNSATWYNRGVQYSDKRMPDECISDMTRVIELNPNHWMAIGLRGVERLNKGLADEAIADFTRGIELNPGHAQFWYGRGSARGRKGLVEEAVADLKKALELAPPTWEERSEAQRRLALLETTRLFVEGGRLHESKRYGEAADVFRRIVENYPGSRHAAASAYNAACALARLGEKQKALEWLEKAIELGWKDGDHLERDPDLVSLRQEPTFRRLMSRLKSD